MSQKIRERAPLVADAPTFLRLPAVIRTTGLGRSTIYKLVAEKQFPCPVRLGVRAVAWRKGDVDKWSEARPASRQRVAKARDTSSRRERPFEQQADDPERR